MPELIQTIPGCDKLSADVWLAEVGIDMDCFQKSKLLTTGREYVLEVAKRREKQK
jgi:hypothetical protein